MSEPKARKRDDVALNAAFEAGEAALDQAFIAASRQLHDELRDGMREGRYGGAPIEGEGAPALLLLLRLLEWRGDARTFAGALPHHPTEFGVDEIRETLHRLGFGSTVHATRWRKVRATDAPALVELREGDLRVVAAGAEGRVVALDPSTGLARAIPGRDRVRLVRFRLLDRTATPMTATRLGRFFGDHRRDVGVLFLVATMINAVVIATALGVRAIYDFVIPAGAHDTLLAIGVGVAMALAIDLSLRVLRARIIAHITARVATRVGALMFDILIHMSLERLKGATVSAQINRIRQFEGFLKTLTGPVTGLAVELPFFLAITLALFVIGGPLALIPICVLIVQIVMAIVLLPGQRRREAEHQAHRSHFQNLMIEAALNAQALRAYGVRDVWTAKLDRAAEAAATARWRSTTRQRAVFAVVNAATPAAIAATVAFGAALVIGGTLSIGALVAATILVGRALAPLHQAFTMAWTATDMRATWSQVDRMLQFQSFREQAQPDLTRWFKGAVTVQRVSYRYATSAETALSGIDIKVPAGAFVALTGVSGSGKSTLLRVLSGLTMPQAGSVFVDAVNLRQIRQDELREIVGYAPDLPQLFHGTIAQNLRLAVPTAANDQLTGICEELGLSRWIEALPDGIDTRLDHQTRGLLPNGFRQTLITAQALLGSPRILLLDQPATGLDPALEAAMLNALLRRRGAITIVMVTHRPSHVRAADFELRLEAGRVVRFAPAPKEKDGLS